MESMTSRSLSIVIACYRDAGSVREFYRQLSEVLPRITPNYEIIYVNDASPDNAEEILREISERDPRLVIVNHTRNFGSQNAFISGMRIASGDGIVLMDGDLQDPPSMIPDLAAKWLEGYDIVYGVRVKRKETAFRQIAYKAFYRLFRHLADIRIPVDAGDFGLIDRKVSACLLDEFPEHNVFLRGLRAYTGFRHIGVPYVRDARFDGRSTNSLAGNLSWAAMAIFSFSKKPLAYISVMAAIALLFSALAVVFYLAAYFLSAREAPSGFMTLLLITLILGSVQLLCFAIIGEYLGHIYTEIKRRPRYIVRDVIDNRRVTSVNRDSRDALQMQADRDTV